MELKVSEVSFPGPGPDGEQPPPVGPARDETAGAAADARPDERGSRTAAPQGDMRDEATGARQETVGLPLGVPEDDWDGDAEMAAYIADLEAGRARIPEEWETSDAV
jgi:hypothetical protein